VHLVNFAAKLVHTGRTLSSFITNSHQEPISSQACNLPNSQSFFLLYGGGFLRNRVPKRLLFLNSVGSGFHCLCILCMQTCDPLEGNSFCNAQSDV
jgi:hypothetical protein